MAIEMNTIKVKVKNHTYLYIDADTDILYEIKEFFTFFVDGYKFSPKYKMKMWTGTISLLNLTSKTLPSGLWDQLSAFAVERGYTFEMIESNYGMPGETVNVLPEDIVDYIKGLNLHSQGKKIEVRDYQLHAIYQAIKYKRKTVIASTGSGKSLIMYCLIRYLIDNELANRALITVPSTSLVLQLTNDFLDYASEDESFDESMIHQVMSGKEKFSNKPITISTWQSQSQNRMDHTIAQSYDIVCVDECQGLKGIELIRILDKCTEASFKYGFTGSLNKSKTDKTQIQGMLGPIIKVTETKKLIEQGHLSEMQIKCITLDYQKATKSMVSHNKDYHLEIDFLVSHERRNKFIRNLAMSLEGNTLVLYTLVEKHGDVLNELFKEKVGERKYFYIHGGVNAEERDEMRPIIEANNNAIILASYGTLSVGINIKRLHNIILASPTKSIIRLLQSIGRGLRKGEGKDELVVYDLSDDLSNSKSKKNFTYKHFVERLLIYNEEQFDYTLTRINIE